MDYPEQSPQDNNEPMPTYNLWARSPFYREREFIPRHFYTMSANEREGAQSSFQSEEKEEIIRDSSNRRIIQKDSLYTNPDLFNEHDKPSKTIFAQLENRQWTDSFWRRAGLSLDNELRVADKRKKGKGKESVSRPFKKNFMDALTPLKSSKAESMMQKMGWQGGALGRGGNGIVEPITPNINYAQRTIGFGQCTDSPKTNPRNMSTKKNIMKKAREIFITNTLLHILEFVRNDWEIEIIFDSVLTNKERAIIHQCVNEIINSDDEVTHHQVKITTHQQLRALTDIRQYNTYVLCTVSLGAVPMRQLNLYKEAPEHVYLVTPEDFDDDEVEIIEDNPFLKSIKRNLDGENLTDTGDRGKLLKFFLEFIRDDSFTEFRFLGPFTDVQAECLSLFVGDVSEAITGDDHDDDGTVSKLRKLFGDEGVRCELVDNCNGSMVGDEWGYLISKSHLSTMGTCGIFSDLTHDFYAVMRKRSTETEGANQPFGALELRKVLK